METNYSETELLLMLLVQHADQTNKHLDLLNRQLDTLLTIIVLGDGSDQERN